LLMAVANIRRKAFSDGSIAGSNMEPQVSERAL